MAHKHTFGERLRQAIAASGQDVKAVSESSGISRAGIYALLDGTTHDPRFVTTVIPLARALAIATDELVPNGE
jgi:DNA-binding phage protein